MLPEALAQQLKSHGQEHLVQHAAGLAAHEAARFAADIASLDFALLRTLQQSLRSGPPAAPQVIEPLPQLVRGADAAGDSAARVRGEAMLKAGRVAAFVVAGGQGTRLGASGPKGKHPAAAISGASLFQVFAEKLLHRGRKAGRAIPWCVMTSPENDSETQEFFAQHAFFGLDPNDVLFFQQGTLPALDDAGRLLLRSATALFRSPDGHGGSLRALHQSGALQQLRARGVEQLFYFQVDNPLVDMCDPVFLGRHQLTLSEFSSKAVPKRAADEKVGVLGRLDGAAGVIEYSDLPAHLREARDADGQLRFRAGNIAVHVLDCAFIERLVTGSLQLPWHRARKEIPCFDAAVGNSSRVGTKFELFIFDAMPLAQRIMVMEVERRVEFSPIKNRSGDDSPDSCRRDSMELHACWLERAGFAVPRDATGALAVRVEISPLTALGPEDISALRLQPFTRNQDILL